MGIPGGWELIAILAVLVLLFGASKLPNAARSIGQSMRIFKAETKGLKADDSAAKDQSAAPRDRTEALPPSGPQVAPPLEHRQGHSDSTR